MKTVLLIGGTSETAALADALAGAGLRVVVSTATAAELDVGRAPGIRRVCGRRTAEGFAALIREEGAQAVVNAAHPFAAAVREETRRAADAAGVPHLDFARAAGPAWPEGLDAQAAASHEEAARLAAAAGRPLLVTTGARNLGPYVRAARAAGLAITARVLPLDESRAACRAAGLGAAEVVEGRGPFGVDANLELIRARGIGTLVTKESGAAGGLIEKLEAARQAGCRVIVVRRPADPAAAAATAGEVVARVLAAVGGAGPSPAHGGNLRALAAAAGRPPEEILDASANVNPLGPVPGFAAAAADGLARVAQYPDPEASELTAAVARWGGWPAAQVVAGNGASELLYAVCRAWRGRCAVVPAPSYADYARAARLAGMEVRSVRLDSERGFALDWDRLAAAIEGEAMVLLGQPNNPTGRAEDPAALRRFAAAHPAARFVVDESFVEFVAGCGSVADDLPENVVMVRSMTKFYAIPGLRLGYAVAPAGLAGRLRAEVPPWSVNCVAERVGIASLADPDYAARTRAAVGAARAELARGLEGVGGLTAFPAAANFVLVRIDAGPDARELGRRMLARGVAIRVCANFDGLDDRYFRLAVRTPQENARVLAALRAAMGEG